VSKAWSRGSTAAWRRTRAAVLARDQHRCQLRLAGCTTRATEVHHRGARALSGDDPAGLMAVCRHCNLTIGDPTVLDPEPDTLHDWWS
jgi:5-methylcytosine-specific restriction endonuclease McrA